MKATFAVLALAAVATAHTQEEIERKGREVMEEYRRDRGHWIFLNSQGMVDHMVDHMGANGLAVAGFFISKKHYRDAEVRLARSVCPAAFASTPRAPRAPRSPRPHPPILRRRFAAG